MDTIDDIGRRAAAALHAEADAVSNAELDTMLAALLVGTPAPLRPGGRLRRDVGRRRRWALAGAAAAIVAALAGGIVVVGNRTSRPQLVPAPSVPPSPVPTQPAAPSTGAPTVPPATGPTTSIEGTTQPQVVDTGLAVSYRNPPPTLDPQIVGSVTLGAADFGNGVALIESGVAVLHETTATVLAWDGSSRVVELDVDFDFAGWIVLAGGPGDVLYLAATGVNPTDLSAATIVAIALSGDRAGRVVATAASDVNRMIERPAGWVGHGPTGLIDREGLHDQLIAYVDQTGAPWPGVLPVSQYQMQGDTVVNTDGSQSWPLQIERAARVGDEYVGNSPPAPAPGGGAVWWDTIGPPSSGGDYPAGTMPVIAFLEPDGSATWRRIPDGWGVATSDTWGTVLVRLEGSTISVALATPSAVAEGQPVSTAEQTAIDYFTALAAGDYGTAAGLLGNDGQDPKARPDLAPVRSLLESGSTLAEALRVWCESDGGAACWMPARIAHTGAPAPHAQPDGTIVIADYEYRGVGPQGSFVVGSREGRPSVYGLPPLVDVFAMSRLTDLLGVDSLWALHPDDQLADGRRSAVVATASATRNVGGPTDTVGATLSADRETLWWSTGDGGTTVTDMAGTTVCRVGEPIVDLLGAPGSYRALVERQFDAGSQDAPVPTPTFEIDCASGAETATRPRSWSSGPVTERTLIAGERTFSLRSTGHHGELRNEAGLEISAGDSMVTSPVFNADGTITVYGDDVGGANPDATLRYLARDTGTGELLWTYESPTALTGAYVTGDRVILTAAIADDAPAIHTGSVVALDLATGHVEITVPATFTLLGAA